MRSSRKALQYQHVFETAKPLAALRGSTFQPMVAASQNAAAESGALVTPTGSTTVSRAGSVLTTGVGVGAAAVMAVIALLAAIELRRGRRIDQVAVVVNSQDQIGEGEPTVEWRSYRRVGMSSISDRVGRLPPMVLSLGWWLLAPVGFIASFGEVALLSSSKTVLALVVAIPLGLAFAVLAVTRFEVFLMALIVVRASLDAFNLASADGGSTGVDPGIMVGAVFTLCAALWLLAQRRSGYWIKVSAPTWALWSFVGACVLSIPTSFALAGSVLSTTKVVAGVLMFSVLEQYLKVRPSGREHSWSRCSVHCHPGGGRAWQAVGQWRGQHLLVDVSRVTAPFCPPSSLAD